MSGNMSRAFDEYFAVAVALVLAAVAVAVAVVAVAFEVGWEKGLARGRDSACSPILGGM